MLIKTLDFKTKYKEKSYFVQWQIIMCVMNSKKLTDYPSFRETLNIFKKAPPNS